MELVQLLGAVVGGYLLGCIPSAYWLVRWTTGQDIRRCGTGSVGAANAYEVTGRPWVGVVVALADILKGYAAVQLAHLLGGTAEFRALATAAVMVVIGHNYNLFLGWAGGRGLAPAAGSLIAISWLPLLLWCLLWLTGYAAIRRNVHVGNMAGTIGTPILIATAPEPLVRLLLQVPCPSILQHTLFVVALAFPIFLRHLQPIRELFRQEEP
ncbi:MAG: glycerol-3-phosphate acyltransferase [Candidatus Kapabacteria bacterium]|nr:glycerol-3-phosphate acyltransferase [Candidatus Kapabacteria bacterium]MCS7170419.1 glycerol-3-phosphate acyltransferase [Candidatus Kapabacteria bacterium]MDW7996614.1 glycerol-3-phosphate acyltransferase [Bacteroidota bacterium]MDW8224634.1 glycerol-3-phosphate acyltransferase [Bacteroidota bacterium]